MPLGVRASDNAARFHVERAGQVSPFVALLRGPQLGAAEASTPARGAAATAAAAATTKQQQQQEPAPVTPTGVEDNASLLHRDPEPSVGAAATDDVGATTPAACGDVFGCCPEHEGLFLDAAGAAAAAAAAAAEVVVAAPEFTAIQPSPIRSRHRRSKKRKVSHGDGVEDGHAGAAASTAQERAIGFVLDKHTEQEGDDAFSPEMNALGSILDGSSRSSSSNNNGGGDGGGERPTKIARVSPSPLTLPVVMMAKPATEAEPAAGPHGAGGRDRMVSAFSGLGSQQALVDFLQPPPILPRMRQSGARRRAARTTTRRPVPNSPRAAAAASGSIWGWGGFTGGGRNAVSGAAAAASAAAEAASLATISFSPGERAPTE